MNKPLLTIAVPCCNEEEVLQETSNQLLRVLTSLIKDNLIQPDSKILFIDDGSRDHTWALIEALVKKSTYLTGLKLTRNFGHQNALLAGLQVAGKHSDCIITIDADLQDDIQVIRTFVERYQEGYDIVYGVRRSRQTDSFFKRNTAQGFYRFMTKLGIKMVYNHADFRLLSKKALKELSRYGEQNMFLRGIIPLLGLTSTEVQYDRKERMAGETKYPLKKMLSFAFNGITSFSIVPIRLIMTVGIMAFFLSSLFGVYALFAKFFGHTDSGWTSIMISLWFLGGLLLISVGLIGEYIGKIYEETKHRPRFSVENDLFSSAFKERKVPTPIVKKTRIR
ncbi:glycosyltransferase family 2 protein [Terrilactibacillus laevilacticus]|uniref:Glycosyltransferase family 2 protein n=1 Tax=Terrilactibacillus laevilacticus TaxID=1380157 RepID=A0ABW5PT23_9BACI|nr:glycosyltransferase family 2 protein [Terrilactibacillus laevilacticus]